MIESLQAAAAGVGLAGGGVCAHAGTQPSATKNDIRKRAHRDRIVGSIGLRRAEDSLIRLDLKTPSSRGRVVFPEPITISRVWGYSGIIPMTVDSGDRHDE
jgi:hypothetical protein